MKFCVWLIIILLSVCQLAFFKLHDVQANDEPDAAQIFAQEADAVVTVAAGSIELCPTNDRKIQNTKRNIDNRNDFRKEKVNKKRAKIGSGFLIRSDGVLLTNYHVIKGSSQIVVKLRNKQVYPVIKILGVDRWRDIALLKIEAKDLKVMTMADSDRLAVGERVVTIGNPLGLESTVADGLLSGFRDVNGINLLQISVPLSNGSSGGPLLNLKGEVVGITTASLTKGQNLNFAVPINYAKILLSRVKFNQSGLRKKNAKVKVLRDSKVEENENSRGEKVRIYVVEPKDSLFGIARKFQTTPSAILKLNQRKDSILRVGERIQIPLD